MLPLLALTPLLLPSLAQGPLVDGPSARGAAQEPAALVGPSNFEEVRDHVVPADEELAWRSLAWHPTLWSAVARAHEEHRPILLWAMNGHPLGST